MTEGRQPARIDTIRGLIALRRQLHHSIAEHPGRVAEHPARTHAEQIIQAAVDDREASQIFWEITQLRAELHQLNTSLQTIANHIAERQRHEPS